MLTYREWWNWILFEPYDATKHEGRRRYAGHWTTCKDSPLWRKRKKPKTRRKHVDTSGEKVRKADDGS